LAIAGNEPDGLGLLLALEGLVMGIVGKALLWRALAAANLSKLEIFDFEKLRRRAGEQIKRAQAEQVRSARRALVDKGVWRGAASGAKPHVNSVAGQRLAPKQKNWFAMSRKGLGLRLMRHAAELSGTTFHVRPNGQSGMIVTCQVKVL